MKTSSSRADVSHCSIRRIVAPAHRGSLTLPYGDVKLAPGRGWPQTASIPASMRDPPGAAQSRAMVGRGCRGILFSANSMK
jgi:hypothetical protein